VSSSVRFLGIDQIIMRKDYPSNSKSIRILWDSLLILCVILGLIVVLDIYTDYSLSNVWASLLYPIVLGAFSFWVYRMHRGFISISIARICCMPLVIVGIIYAIVVIFSLLPPFSIIPVYSVDNEMFGGKVYQRIESPDGYRIAEGIYRYSGSDASGSKTIHVRIKYSNTPFIQREFYVGRHDSLSSNNRDFTISWIDNTRLSLIDDGKNVEIGTNIIEFAPTLFELAIMAVFKIVAIIVWSISNLIFLL